MNERYSLAILGGGPGGYVAALRAAQLGAQVALIDEGGIGGTCLQRGCIPTKALLASAERFDSLAHGADFGVFAEKVRFDMAQAMRRKNGVVAELVAGIEKVLIKRGVEIIRGRGRLTGLGTIQVDGHEQPVHADKIIIATGSSPIAIPAFSIDGSIVMNSSHALNCETLPESMLIVGGGVIGCEFATFYSMVGVKVTLVEALDRLLLMADKPLAKQVQVGLKRRGVTVKTKVRITKLAADAGRAVAQLEDGHVIETDQALVAIGRRPRTENIGLDELGIECDERGAIVVDQQLRTSVPNIHAIGDVTGRWWLAHVASAQGMVAAECCCGQEQTFDDRVIPAVTFTKPELAQVGLTEAQCKEAGIEYRQGRFMFGANGKALTLAEGQGTIKLLVSPDGSTILGCHILGAHASDLISEVALAMRNGLGAREISKTIHAHPTLAEVVHEAAEAALGRPVHQI